MSNSKNSSNWIELTDKSSKTFQLEGKPELIHVIKTGFKDKYIAVHEDAHEKDLGKVEFGTKKEFEKKFEGIKL